MKNVGKIMKSLPIQIETKVASNELIDRKKKRKKRDRAEGRKIDLTIHVWHNHRSFHCIERGVCVHIITGT